MRLAPTNETKTLQQNKSKHLPRARRVRAVRVRACGVCGVRCAGGMCAWWCAQLPTILINQALLVAVPVMPKELCDIIAGYSTEEADPPLLTVELNVTALATLLRFPDALKVARGCAGFGVGVGVGFGLGWCCPLVSELVSQVSESSVSQPDGMRQKRPEKKRERRRTSDTARRCLRACLF